MVLVLAGIVEIRNGCVVVVFEGIGSETVVVLLDGGFAVVDIGTAIVAGVVNVVSGRRQQKYFRFQVLPISQKNL